MQPQRAPGLTKISWARTWFRRHQMSLRNLGGRTLVRAALQRRSLQLAGKRTANALCALGLCAAAVGSLAWMQGVRAQAQQAQQAQKAPPDLATLVQAGDTKQALAQIQAG